MRVGAAGISMVLLALPLLTGCGNNGTRPAVPNGSEQAGTVVLAKAEARPMERIITVTGTFSAQETSVLSAKVSGRLQDLRVDIGSKVGQGDLLAQIEPRDYELGLQQAAVALAQARTALGPEPEGTDDSVNLFVASRTRIISEGWELAA